MSTQKINFSEFEISKEALHNRGNKGYITHKDGRRFYYERYYACKYLYRVMPTETAEGEPLMDADWLQLNF